MNSSTETVRSAASTHHAEREALVVHAPAKLNLSLRVLGKREDGYHELESDFVAVSLYDTLRFRSRGDGRIQLTVLGAGRDVKPDDSNLVMRAARIAANSSKTSLGADIILAKRIPSQAGLGGGSSDAAATLIGLNRLWKLRLSTSKLHELAAQLGSDLNFFIARKPLGMVSGRGDRVTSVPLRQTFSVVIAKPHFGASTQGVFKQLQITTSNLQDPRQKSEQQKYVQNVLSGQRLPNNDLQPALQQFEPRFKDWVTELDHITRSTCLREGSQPFNASTVEQPGEFSAGSGTNRSFAKPLWTLTGSGTAVYRFVPTRRYAESVAARVRSAMPTTEVFVAGPGRMSINRDNQYERC